MSLRFTNTPITSRIETILRWAHRKPWFPTPIREDWVAALFTVSGDTVGVLSPSSFQDQYLEADLQRWADFNPHFINDGVPMISLGREITTKFGHYIDNLFIDGNGCLVIAEMKRGKTPRDVTSQLLDYAIFAKELGLEEIEGFCRARHGDDLETVFKRTFGVAPPDGTPCDHRLLVVAEDFDERTIEHCFYLMEKGTPVACLQFTYYQVGNVTVLETQTVVGEIPDQSVKPAEGATNPYEGRFQWLFSKLSDRFGTFASKHGWQPKVAVSKWSLSFSPLSWPDHHWKRAFFVSRRSNEKVVDVGFWYHTPAYPDLQAFIEEQREAFGAIPEFVYGSSQKTLYLTFHQFPLPEIGEDEKVVEIAGCAEEMAEGLLPLVSAYFDQREESRSETAQENPVALEANSPGHSGNPDSEAP